MGVFFPEYSISKRKIGILASLLFLINYFLSFFTFLSIEYIIGEESYFYLLVFYFLVSFLFIVFYDLKTSRYRMNNNFTYLFSKNDLKYRKVLLAKAIDNQVNRLLLILSPVFLSLVTLNVIFQKSTFFNLIQLCLIFILFNVIFISLRIFILLMSFGYGILLQTKIKKIQSTFFLLINLFGTIVVFFLPMLIFERKYNLVEKCIYLFKIIEVPSNLAFLVLFLSIITLALMYVNKLLITNVIKIRVYSNNEILIFQANFKKFNFENFDKLNIYFVKDFILFFRDKKNIFIEFKNLIYFLSGVLGMIFAIKSKNIFQYDEFVFGLGVLSQFVIIETLNLFIARYFGLNNEGKLIKWFVSTSQSPYSLIVDKLKNQIVLISFINEIAIIFICFQFENLVFLFPFTIINICTSIVTASSNMIAITILPSFINIKEDMKQNLKSYFFNSMLSTIYEFIIFIELSIIGAFIYAGKMTSTELYVYVVLTSLFLAIIYLILILLLSFRTSWRGWLNGY